MDATVSLAGNQARSGRWSDEILAKLYHRILNRIDEGLAVGTMEIVPPDGRVRTLGGRAAGPSCRITIHDWRALSRLAWSGSNGLYEGWAAGEWHSAEPVPFFELIMRNRQSVGTVGRAKGWQRIVRQMAHRQNRNTKPNAQRNIMAHYDLGNDFYAAWLDPTMSYSSAIFAPGDDLETAQRRKQAEILDRLQLTPGATMLEIGCGWGSLAGAAQARGALVTAISLSPSQLEYARAHHDKAIDFRLCDYRDVEGIFDAIASIEMVEAVGEQYWPAYLDAIARLLKPGGRAAIQYISIADDVFEAYRDNADFIQTYVFPGGMLLSESRFRALAEARGLSWTDKQCFAKDYADTLQIWHERFNAASLPEHFDQQFKDLWNFYLQYCQGGFRGGGIDVAQVTLVKGAL
jgi:cyclopropane-fatty-acyl-phospholipid synthase